MTAATTVMRVSILARAGLLPTTSRPDCYRISVPSFCESTC
jgi:hypothetical protein